jgi:hypothetical protein
MLLSRDGDMLKMTVECQGRRRCKRSSTLNVSVWMLWGTEPEKITRDIRRAFWILGWKEKPSRHRKDKWICPACRKAHDPHQHGHFPPYLKTP